MQSSFSDEDEYRCLTAPCACLEIRLASDEQGEPELQIFGNRAGILSLANVLLWLVANSWRREFLAFSDLPFVYLEVPFSISLRVTSMEPTGQDGFLRRTDRDSQFEWSVTQDDLERIALLVHRLASNPAHEYDRLTMTNESEAGVHIRMTDAAEWLGAAK